MLVQVNLITWKVSPSYSPGGLFKHKLLNPTTSVPDHFRTQEWGLHICSSNKFPSEATATHQLGEPHFEKYWSIFPSSYGWPVCFYPGSSFHSSVQYSWVLDLLSELLSQVKSSLDLLFWQLYQTENYYLQKFLTIYPTFLLSNWVPGYLSLLEKKKSLHVLELN